MNSNTAVGRRNLVGSAAIYFPVSVSPTLLFYLIFLNLLFVFFILSVRFLFHLFLTDDFYEKLNACKLSL